MFSISVFGVDMPHARRIAQSIQKVIDDKGLEGYAIPGIVDPAWLRERGATKYPVIIIDDKVVWEGEIPDIEIISKWFKRGSEKKVDDLRILQRSIQELGKAFNDLFEADLGKLNETEYYLFLVSFTFACYAYLKKGTDKEAFEKIGEWIVNIMIERVYTKHNPAASQSDKDKYLNQMAKLIEKRQDEYIELLLQDLLKPKGAGAFGSITRRTYANLFNNVEKFDLLLSVLLVEHLSKLQAAFSKGEENEANEGSGLEI